MSNERHSCGTVAGPDDPEGADVFSDQLCLVCGHAPCPCCNGWCDVLGKLTEKTVNGKVHSVVLDDPDDPDGTKPHDCDRCERPAAEHTGRRQSKCPDGKGDYEHDTGMCCDGKCTYAAPPVFTKKDGTPWP